MTNITSLSARREAKRDDRARRMADEIVSRVLKRPVHLDPRGPNAVKIREIIVKAERRRDRSERAGREYARRFLADRGPIEIIERIIDLLEKRRDKGIPVARQALRMAVVKLKAERLAGSAL